MLDTQPLTVVICLFADAKLSQALKLRSCPSEGVPGESLEHNTPLRYQWELPADTVLATDIDAAGEERPILRVVDAISGFTSAFESITFSTDDRRRSKVLLLYILHV